MAIRPTDHFAAASGTAHPAVVAFRENAKAFEPHSIDPHAWLLNDIAQKTTTLLSLAGGELDITSDMAASILGGFRGNNGAQASIVAQAKEKQESKKRAELQAFLNILQDQIDGWQRDIEAINIEIDEIDAQITLIAQIRELVETGEFDFENAEHRQMLQDAGVDLDAAAQDLIQALDDSELDLNARKDVLEAKRAELEAKIEENLDLIDVIDAGHNFEMASDGSGFKNKALEEARNLLGIDATASLKEEEKDKIVEHLFTKLGELEEDSYKITTQIDTTLSSSPNP